MAFFARNSGFLFPECWLFIFVSDGFFHPDYAYGLFIDDKDADGMAELQMELKSYLEWAKEKLSGSYFESCEEARKFFDQEWKPIILGGKVQGLHHASQAQY